MAFTGGGILGQAITFGIIVSVTNRAEHGLRQFRDDVGKTQQQIAFLNAEMAKARLGAMRWGIAAVGLGAVYHGFTRMARGSEDLEVSLKNIQLLTGASTTQMDAFTQSLIRASDRTRFTTAKVAELARQFAVGVPGLAMGPRGFGEVSQVAPTLAEVASVLQIHRQMAPERTTAALAAMVNMFAPEKTAAQMEHVSRMGGAALMFGPWNDPERLSTSLGYMQRAFPRTSMEEQVAFINLLTTRGQMARRSASMGGQAWSQLINIAFGEDRAARMGFSIPAGAFPEMGGVGFGGRQGRLAGMRADLGLNEIVAQALAKERTTGVLDVSIRAFFSTIQQHLLSMPPSQRATAIGRLPVMLRGAVAPFADPQFKFMADFDLAVQKATRGVGLFDTMIEVSNRTLQGSRERMQSNFEDLTKQLGLSLNPGFAALNTQIGNALIWMTSFAQAHRGFTNVLIQSIAGLVGVGMLRAGIGLGGVAAAGLTGMGLIAAGGTIATIVPYVVAAVAAYFAIRMFAPAVVSAWRGLTGYNPDEEAAQLAQAAAEQRGESVSGRPPLPGIAVAAESAHLGRVISQTRFGVVDVTDKFLRLAFATDRATTAMTDAGAKVSKAHQDMRAAEIGVRWGHEVTIGGVHVSSVGAPGGVFFMPTPTPGPMTTPTPARMGAGVPLVEPGEIGVRWGHLKALQDAGMLTPDVNTERSSTAHFSFNSSSTSSLSAEMSAPRSRVQRTTRVQVRQSGAKALTHPRALGMRGR